MTFIKIIFFSIAFHFFAPVNSYAIIQTNEKPKSETRKMPRKEQNLLLLGSISFGLGIYPFVKGIILWQAAANVVSVSVGVLMFGVGGIIVLASLVAFGQYFFERYKRKQNGY